MIAVTMAFKPKDTGRCLKAEPVQAAVGAQNIASIVYRGYDKWKGKTLWRVTCTAMTLNRFATGMSVTIAGTLAHNGTFPIVAVDVSNFVLDIETTIERIVGNGGAVGTATPSGVALPSVINAGTPILNNNGEILYESSYATAQSFVWEASSNDTQPIIQVNNTGTQPCSVTITYSLDRVNWIAFPTPIAAVSVAAGTAGGFLMNQINFDQVYLRIDVTITAGAVYTVIVR